MGPGCPGPPILLAGLGCHPPHPTGRAWPLPTPCCPSTLPAHRMWRMADLFQITGQPDLDFVKIVLVQPGQGGGWMHAPRPQCGSQGSPAQTLPTPALGPPSGVRRGACALRVAQQPVVGPGVACQGTETVWGCSELLGAGPSVGPQGRRPSASTLSPWTAVGWTALTDGVHALPSW